MKPAKSVHSVRSLRSSRSLRSGRDERKADSLVKSFENMMDVACSKFQCPYTVIVKKETNHDDYYKALMKYDRKPIGRAKKISYYSQPAKKNSEATSSVSSVSAIASSNKSIRSDSITVTMVYDNFNTLTEIVIKNIIDVPPILVKIICVLAPFYKKLTGITISNCKINMYTIYELSKMLKVSTINSICLDGSAMPLGDFTMLLNTTNLTNLSLCRCNLNDNDCELIASKLHNSAPANNLLLLNLSSNRITDVGAKYIADSLRTNRHLRYLNLTDNHIEDVGAGYIFDILIEFPLTCNEIMSMRRRRMEFLRLRNDLYSKYLAEYYNKAFDEISQLSRTSRRKKSKSITLKGKDRSDRWVNEEYLKTKAEMVTIDILGNYFRDPFQPDTVKYVDEYYYSLGNVSLQYLNLAYNNLSYISIKKLCNVVQYQNERKLGNRGLIKVVVDGNNLPITCVEMDVIKGILGKKIMRNSGRISEIIRRKNRSSKY